MPRQGVWITYRNLVLVGSVVCAVVAALMYLLVKRVPTAEDAMKALAIASKDERRIPLRISRIPEWSAFSRTRGGYERSSLLFDRALQILDNAEQAGKSTSPDLQLTRAKIYLARAESQDGQRALAILKRLADEGVASPELLNETGVAFFEVGSLEEAVGAFTRAIEMGPNLDEALYNRAVLETEIGRLQDAERDWMLFMSRSKDERWNEEARRALDQMTQTWPDTKR